MLTSVWPPETASLRLISRVDPTLSVKSWVLVPKPVAVTLMV
jgi:hypothetical protein